MPFPRLIALLIVSYFCFHFNYSVQAQQAWTLEQCLSYALDKNIQIKQAELNQQLAESNLFQSTFQMMSPSINGDLSGAVNYGRFVDPTTNQFVNQQQTTYSTGLSARLTLFSGLSQWFNMRQNKMNVEATKFDTENTRNNVMLTITRAFLQILLSKEELKAAQAQLDLSLEQNKQAATLFDVGTVPLGNKLDAEAQLSRDSMNFIMAQNILGLAKLQLSIILQLNPDENFDILTPSLSAEENPAFLNETAEQVYQLALGNQPSIKSAYFRERSAQLRYSSAKELQFPTITMFSNIRTNYSSGFEDYSYRTIPNEFDTLGYVAGLPITTQRREIVSKPISFGEQFTQNLAKIVGVSVNIPILNGWQARTNIKAAKLNKMNAHLQLMQAENQLKQDVYTSFADAKNAFQSYHATKKSYEAFKKSLEYNEDRYKVGALNSLQYNTARISYANAEIQHIRAKYDYIFKLKVLDFYKGNAITLN
jgi:outer membrane protein